MSAHPIPLTTGQRLGVAAWRTMMTCFGALSRLQRVTPPGPVTEHAYGDHPAERLDRIEAAPDVPARAPIVYVHGGGWICGKKSMYTSSLVPFAAAGHPVFNLEYPLAPERPHPHMLRSLLSAIAWIHERYPEHEAVHLMGDSAGGNLVTMLGILMSNEEALKAVEPGDPRPMPALRSVASLYGVLDRLSWIEHQFPGARLMLHCYAGPAATASEVGPELAITPMDLDFEALPPTFLTVGSKDQLAASSELCADRFQAQFADVSYKVYEGEGHGFFNLNRPASRELVADLLEFFRKH